MIIRDKKKIKWRTHRKISTFNFRNLKHIQSGMSKIFNKKPKIKKNWQ